MGEAQPPVYDPNSDWKNSIKPVAQQAHTYGSPNTGGASSGGGFKYDEATLHQLVKDWNDLANEFQDDLVQAITIQRAEGPGLEYASGGNAEMIKASGNALHATLSAREQYCRSMAAKYQAALGKYAKTEGASTTEIQHTGGSL